MSKELDHIYDEYESYESEETIEEVPKITKEEFQMYQQDEKYEMVSNVYDFFKNYMDSKTFAFPIMELYSIKSIIHLVNKFTVPRNY
jgi:hypothetical protein